LQLQDLPLGERAAVAPFAFSFRYGGTNSSELLTRWTRKTDEQAFGPNGSIRTISWLDPRTGLEVKLEATRFSDFPAVEWVAHLTNHGHSNTPIIENLQAIDTSLLIPASGDPSLHWARGAVASFDDFAPQTTRLKPGEPFRLSSGEGRSSSQVLPFFNLAGASDGAILALGWSGSWTADFMQDSQGQISLHAGQERTHLVLYPGETIRTPRMLLLFYEGDHERGQNLLRQFILTHHRPTRSGQPLEAPITCGNWGGTRAEVHLDNIQQIVQQQLPIAFYWIDAEWFGHGGWPVNVGNWEVKPDLYPQGFKPISDALRKSGRELLVWFEPERVFKNTAWYREHHDFLIDTGGENSLFNLGDPVARKFLADFISQKIEEFELGCYRQDFNMDPGPFWKAADEPDRQGITENKYIQGLYAFWDELLARYPGLIIDNCASGGRRIDLETIGRATPFWRTDGPRDAIAHQCHTYGLLSWIPLSSTSQDRAGDDYEFRSSMCSGLCLNWWVSGDVSAERIPENFPFAWARKTLDQYLTYRQCYYGDYFPLTGYSQTADLWMAYQLDQPKPGRGMIVVLRRPESPYESARFNLRALEPQIDYRVTNLDTGEETDRSGRELAETGLEVRLQKRPSSALILYERKTTPGGSTQAK
jgi:alpha-galactosidase